MPNRTMTDRLHVTPLLSGVKTTEAKSAGVDASTYDTLEFICHVGVITNIGNSPVPSWSLRLQHSDVDSDGAYVACEDADVRVPGGAALGANGQFALVNTASLDDATYRAGYRGGKKFARLVATPADTPGNTPIVAQAVGRKALIA
jgi:hypothetical protein